MRALWIGSIGLVVGCGGTVVFEVEGDGGDGGAPSTTSSTPSGPSGAGGEGASTATTGGSTVSVTTGTSSSVSSGPGGCVAHAECPGGLCLFDTGVCTESCVPFACDRCTAGEVCEPCGTSSCPACGDCIAACVPTSVGRCDDDDPCGPQEVCMFNTGFCAPSCDSPACADPNMVCDRCATSSGCGDDDCVAACVSTEEGSP